MTDEHLIEAVRKYSFLYDLSHPKYCDLYKKEHAWKEISEEVKQPAAACKQKWQSLRDCFRRALNKRKTRSVYSVKRNKKWKYEDEMEFLTPFFTEKKFHTSVNVSSDEELSHNTEFTENEGNVKYENTENEPSPNVNTNDYVDTTAEAALAVDITSATTANIVDAGTSQTKSVKSSNMKKNNKSKSMGPPATASSMLMTYLLEEKRNRVKHAKHDDLDRFFLSMSATVKQFSLYNQAIAKNKIFSIISDMEIEQLAPHSFDSNTPYPLL